MASQGSIRKGAVKPGGTVKSEKPFLPEYSAHMQFVGKKKAIFVRINHLQTNGDETWNNLKEG